MHFSKQMVICLIAVCLWCTPRAHSSPTGDSGKDTLQQENLYYPEYDFDYIPDASYELVKARYEKLNPAISVQYNETVKSFIDYFTVRDRKYTRLVIERSHQYFPLFEKYLKKHGLPEELKYLAIVESGLNPVARSWVGAVGLWQFMPATGRIYKLHQDWYIDERMDAHQATDAACRYLKTLYGMFDDWELALAAYNAGPGNVRKAIRRSGYKDSFWEVYRYLPRETRSYVPQFAAMIYVMNHQNEHNLYEEPEEFVRESDTVLVSQYVHLETLADQLNICADDLKELNSGARRGAIPDKIKSYPLYLPKDKMDLFRENRLAILEKAGTVGKKRLEYLARNSVGSTYGRDRISYRVRSGDVLGKIARRYRVRVADIRKWNRLRGNTIRIGQRLTIWINPKAAPKYAYKKKKVQKVINGKTYYYVQPGDTLWDIANKYKHLDIRKLKKLNNLRNNNIKPGQKLVVS